MLFRSSDEPPPPPVSSAAPTSSAAPVTTTVSNGDTIVVPVGVVVVGGPGGGFFTIAGAAAGAAPVAVAAGASVTAGSSSGDKPDDPDDPNKPPSSAPEAPSSAPPSSAPPPSSNSVAPTSTEAPTSTSSAVPSETPAPHVIYPKTSATDQEKKDFLALIDKDLGQGNYRVTEGTKVLLVAANITTTQRDNLIKNPLVGAVDPDEPDRNNQGTSVLINERDHDDEVHEKWWMESLDKLGRIRKRAVVKQATAPTELVILSQPPGVDLKTLNTYAYDDSAGIEITVYILDSGYYAKNAEYTGMAVKPRWIFGGSQEKASVEEDLDPDGHGTCAGSKINGPKFGVAKNVNLVVVKAGIKGSDTDDALDKIVDDVRERKLQGKAIVNISRCPAPTVAGLAAYLLAVGEYPQLFEVGKVAANMQKLLMDMAYQRAPDGGPVIFNGQGAVCGRPGRSAKFKRQDLSGEACSVVSSTTTIPSATPSPPPATTSNPPAATTAPPPPPPPPPAPKELFSLSEQVSAGTSACFPTNAFSATAGTTYGFSFDVSPEMIVSIETGSTDEGYHQSKGPWTGTFLAQSTSSVKICGSGGSGTLAFKITEEPSEAVKAPAGKEVFKLDEKVASGTTSCFPTTGLNIQEGNYGFSYTTSDGIEIQIGDDSSGPKYFTGNRASGAGLMYIDFSGGSVSICATNNGGSEAPLSLTMTQ
ncbi:hypothetical protein COL26b_013975 [Colletotrichum chrysophilum]|uniref:uncharacterized protein n=1 Tax=Colletotrichum chrysophilum TaxID=1836956 RepID=UPI0023002623|nr:uncharacterized protein COL26b_013975 [Colletotrichum chrysophilum]KAJ0360787.1 hypothetical protein COL26b_013975 [Colletotrichum chrysophilum]